MAGGGGAKGREEVGGSAGAEEAQFTTIIGACRARAWAGGV